MQKTQIENVIFHVIGRFPTQEELKECRPDKIERPKKYRIWFTDRYGR